MNPERQLHIKKITFDNPGKIKRVGIEWKYNPQTKTLNLRIIREDFMSHGSGYIHITEATRDYNEWMGL